MSRVFSLLFNEKCNLGYTDHPEKPALIDKSGLCMVAAGCDMEGLGQVQGLWLRGQEKIETIPASGPDGELLAPEYPPCLTAGQGHSSKTAFKES